MDLAGTEVAVLGAGRSGSAAARLALRLGGEVTIYDSAGPDAFGGMPEGVAVHPHATADTGRACRAPLVIISPGIEPDGEFAASFAAGAEEMIGETEFAYRHYEGRIVGITGTNGKTTTTELVQRILTEGGTTCEACGNYGRPLADVVLGETVPAALALELSSFQLETVARFRPDVAIWLNLSPDHMDRYRSVADYRAAKLRIFENQTAEDVAVVRLGEDVGEIAARRVSFSATETGGDYSLDGSHLCLDGERILDLGITKLRGIHNAENTMAAIAAGQALGIPASTAGQALAGYAPPLHRCELVRTLDGVEYINDSKATNLHALESALRSQTRPTVLIAGGKEKGLDYRGVLPLLKEKVRAAVLIGEIREPLRALFSEAIEARVAASLEEAVPLARDLASPGGTVLFSPGTSSFDMFSGYEERGDAFRHAAQALK
ncbi:MAG: UDP-N-acetylmuramoyl-L-alanine--D-glutamate ligase [Akkermansiaceae bacterium]|nr:UDP-N-acetylmuramoyl-L-alanine--D-glutamate ligase [Akkermansiaceae bacterium]NNM28837.1 UDP-N-acetylmuramoyl-L-alanine--D-glutamate ligase [Akkermansiaceae bacterium]